MYKIYRITNYYNIDIVGPQVIYSTVDLALEYIKNVDLKLINDTTVCVMLGNVTGLSYPYQFHNNKILHTVNLPKDFKRPIDESEMSWDKPRIDYIILKETLI